MKPVEDNLGEIKAWYARVKDKEATAIYAMCGCKTYVGTEHCRQPWRVELQDRGETVGNIGIGYDLAITDLHKDVFAIIDDALFILEANNWSSDDNDVYARVIIPAGSPLDVKRIPALVEMGIAPVDAMKLVFKQ